MIPSHRPAPEVAVVALLAGERHFVVLGELVSLALERVRARAPDQRRYLNSIIIILVIKYFSWSSNIFLPTWPPSSTSSSR